MFNLIKQKIETKNPDLEYCDLLSRLRHQVLGDDLLERTAGQAAEHEADLKKDIIS